MIMIIICSSSSSGGGGSSISSSSIHNWELIRFLIEHKETESIFKNARDSFGVSVFMRRHPLLKHAQLSSRLLTHYIR